jgi:hypothetical protein
LATAGAQVQAELRPDWEQALSLEPMLEGGAPAPPAFALPEFELAPPEGWQAVDGSELDTMRGGFTTGGGLIVALGIERLVSINGQMVARTSFELAATEGLAGETAGAARSALNHGALIQNGPGNVAPAMLSAEALGATIIQNTLNDQTIRSQTVINASVNSATLMQSLNFHDSVGQAVRDAVRLH